MEPGHKELLIGLLGSTYGELKQLDASITGSSSTLNRRSETIKDELTKIMNTSEAVFNNGIPQPPAPAPAPAPVQIVAPKPPEGAVNLPYIVQVPVQAPIVDNSQLEFDLNKTTRYEDIVESLDRIVRRIDNLEIMISNINEKLDILTKNGSTLLKNKKKIPGIVESSDYNQ